MGYATKKQKRCIKFITYNTGKKFNGYSKRKASSFIKNNIDLANKIKINNLLRKD